MIVYPDTSFLCALYRLQDNSALAVRYRDSLEEPVSVTSIVLYEFRQSVRLQIFLHRNDAAKGYGERDGLEMLAKLENHLEAGILRVMAIDWARVANRAETLSALHTLHGGYGGFDVLHVATAVELSSEIFLTFDLRQARLARKAGLKVRP